MSNSVASELRAAISTIRDKAAEVSDSDFYSDLAAGRVEAAKSRVSSAKSEVQRHQNVLDDIISKLNPPPTKEVSSGKSGTKTVVDTEEKGRLEGQKRNTEAQLVAAKTKVEEAEQEAQLAATDALEKSGMSEEKQAELNKALSQIDNIKDKMEKGEKVEDKEIKGALGVLNKALEGLESNGIVKEAFFEPIEEDLKDILKYLENPVENNGDNDGGETIPPEGTVNRDLHDIGITGDDNTEIVDIMTDFAAIAEGMNNGESVEPAEMQDIYDRYMAKRSGLTSDQISSNVISEFENGFDGVIDATGINVAKIRSGGASGS